ncbi:MAG: hypothetical protein ACPF9D_03790, partial [Owenweeksia sp.]
MKKQLHLIITGLLWGTLCYGQYWNPTGALSSAGANYLIAATHVNGNIYVVGNTQNLAYSTDKGVTWTNQSFTLPKGVFMALYGAGGRLYALSRINNLQAELYYSTDNGLT